MNHDYIQSTVCTAAKQMKAGLNGCCAAQCDTTAVPKEPTVREVLADRMANLARQMARLVEFQDNLPREHLDMGYCTHQHQFNPDSHAPFPL